MNKRWTIGPTILAILVVIVAGCNPLNLKWSMSPVGGDTVLDRLKVECAESGGKWTEKNCDPPIPWRKPKITDPGELADTIVAGTNPTQL